MFDFFYDVFLAFYLIVKIPVVLLNFKKYRSTIVERFFHFSKNKILPKDRKIVWVHAVSLGETKAASLLTKKMKSEKEDLFIVLSTLTKTGFAEGKKNLEVDYHLYLPLDFSFVMKKLMAFFKPHLLILVETDFWYNLLKYAKKNGAAVALVNGKLSDRSFKRFKAFSFFSKKVFSLIDQFLIQDETYLERFSKLGIPFNKMQVTGNLKLDLKNKVLSQSEKEDWINAFKLNSNEKVITIASTHANEEELLLKNLPDGFKYFLVPRHPERFSTVKDILKRSNIPFGVYSQKDTLSGTEKIILIDAMGILNICYQLSSLAIVCGSFVKNIGGHNILEPVFVGTPVFFGPYMHSQEEMKKIVLQSKCGKEISLENIKNQIEDFFSKEGEHRENCRYLTLSLSGNADKANSILKKYY